MDETRANAIYEGTLAVIESLIGTDTTFSTELERVGAALVPGFQGVVAADEQRRLAPGESLVTNLDKRGEPGSHWVALYGLANGDVAVYDSFGRPTKSLTINDTLKQNHTDADQDAEQSPLEANCGARSLAWLVMCDRWGADVAMLV